MLGISPSIGPLSRPLSGSGMSYREETVMVPQHPVVRLVMLGGIISNAAQVQVRYCMPAELAIRRRSALATAALVAIPLVAVPWRRKSTMKGCRMEPYRAGGCGVATCTSTYAIC